ncbi:hypothetical protein [uncultured Varibaculum sp.]|uniref:hypothetical protein n=1 Tax=uncultured Varibaculum sp. TaxID=413896 RepID=UPI0025923673|nr:hypothetical protein [uncultured Varibaculum sp.]
MQKALKLSRFLAMSTALALGLLGFVAPRGLATETGAEDGAVAGQEDGNAQPLQVADQNPVNELRSANPAPVGATPVGTVENLPRWRSLAKNDNQAMPESPDWEPAFGAGSYNFTAEHENVQLPEGQGGWGWDKATHTFTLRNFDDTNYLVQKPGDEVPGKKWRATGLVINARMLTKDQPLTIKFEGINNLGATTSSDGLKPIYVLAGEGDVIIEGAPGAVLNLNPRPFWNDSGRFRGDLYGICVEQFEPGSDARLKTKSGQLKLTGGTVNITGRFTEEEISVSDENLLTERMFTGISTGKDVLIDGNATLSVKLNSTDPSKSGAMAVSLDGKYGGADRITFDTTGSVELDSSDGWPTVYGASYYSGKGSVTHKTYADYVYAGPQYDLVEDDDTYIGVISPINAAQIPDRSGKWSLFRAEDGSYINEATVAAVYAVKAKVKNPDEVTAEVKDGDGNPVTEVIADKHIAIKHEVGDDAYDIAKALGREDRAIAPGATVTLKAPAAPAGYTLNWKLVGVDEDKIAELYAAMGVSAADLEKANLAYIQPKQHVNWQVTYSKKPVPKPESKPDSKPESKPAPQKPVDALPESGVAAIKYLVLLGTLATLAGAAVLRMRKN